MCDRLEREQNQNIEQIIKIKEENIKLRELNNLLDKIVDDKNKLVELNNNQHMKVDLEDRSLIENYNWRIQNHSSYPTTFVYEEKEGEKKRTFISFQQMKYNTQKIHFKNSDRLDFRKSNIILLSA